MVGHIPTLPEPVRFRVNWEVPLFKGCNNTSQVAPLVAICAATLPARTNAFLPNLRRFGRLPVSTCSNLSREQYHQPTIPHLLVSYYMDAVPV